MRYGSVCSGIEAASVAWHPLGWQPAFFSEIEKFPSEVLAHHYPDVPNLGDMTKFQEWPDAAIDVLVGGTPCQSFSVAGLRKGLADPRGNLALTYLGILDRYRPTWMVWENVPGVLSSATHDAPDQRPPAIDLDGDHGPRDGEEVVVPDEYDADETHAFACFLSGLQELGYGFAYRVLDAQFVTVDGHERAVPQRRERVFVVGYLGDWRRAAAVLLERESLLGNPAPRREAGQKIAATLTRGAESGGKGGYAGRRQEDDINIVTSTEGVSHCLNAGSMGRQDYETETMVAMRDVAHSLRAQAQPAHREDQDTLVAFDTTQITSKANRSVPKAGDPCHPLAAGAHAPAIAFAHQQGGNIDLHMSEEVGLSLQRCQTQAVHQGWAVRRLTPTECERLQGFPDGYTAIDRNGKPAADGPRYKALGNSMACNVMRWIGRRIEHVDGIAASIKSEAA